MSKKVFEASIPNSKNRFVPRDWLADLHKISEKKDANNKAKGEKIPPGPRKVQSTDAHSRF